MSMDLGTEVSYDPEEKLHTMDARLGCSHSCAGFGRLSINPDSSSPMVIEGWRGRLQTTGGRSGGMYAHSKGDMVGRCQGQTWMELPFPTSMTVAH